MAELLDVFDANKQHIGIADRTVVHAQGLWHKTVHCWIIWDGKMVFQRRSRNIKDNPNKLYTTASGHIVAGEAAEGALIRETRQEIGVVPENPHLIMEGAFVADIKKTDGTMMIDRAFCNIFYAEYGGELSNLKFKDGEVDSVVAIDLNGFIKWSSDMAAGISGIEWNGRKISTVALSQNDFAMPVGNTMPLYFGMFARLIKADIDIRRG